MAQRANRAFAIGAVLVPVAALLYASLASPLEHHTYVHVMAGVLWTGIDLFMGLVVGPVVGGLDPRARASVFERLTPKMTFLMPALAFVTVFAGMTLATRMGVFPTAEPWIALFSTVVTLVPLALIGAKFDAFDDKRWLTIFGIGFLAHAVWLIRTAGNLASTSTIILVILGIVTVLVVLGFGVLLPNEVLIYREISSKNPDTDRIGELGLRNAKLAGVQGLFQLAIIVAMVYLRFGGF